MARNKSTKPTGAELRALRDQRATEGPYAAQEASRRERSFLSRLTGAKEDFDWILSNEAWTHLGFPSFTAWYVARVQPTIEALGARPAPELANEVLERIREDEAALPPAQRRTKAELAALTGVGEWKVRGRQDQRERRSTRLSDLEETSAGFSVPADQELREGVPDGSAGDGDGTSPVAVPTQNRTEEERPSTGGSDETAPSGVVAQPPVGVPGDEAAEDPSVSPFSGSSAADLEAPAGRVATQPDDPDAGSNQSGEDETATLSSPDGQNPFIEWVHDLVDVVGQRIDAEDGFTTDEDLKLLLRNAVADLQDHLSELEFVWLRDLAGEASA